MTQAEIKESVANNLYDEGMVNTDSDSLNDSIQDAYDEVAIFTGCIEKIATVSLVANLSYYKMTDYITDFFRVIAIWNNDTNKWLEPVHYSGLEDYHPRWETVNGSVIAFSPIGFDYIALFRKPATTTGSLLVFYKAIADTLASSSTPVIPYDDHSILETYATADSLEQVLEYTKAGLYYEEFLKKQAIVIRKLNSRNMSDRIMAMRDVVGSVK